MFLALKDDFFFWQKDNKIHKFSFELASQKTWYWRCNTWYFSRLWKHSRSPLYSDRLILWDQFQNCFKILTKLHLQYLDKYSGSKSLPNFRFTISTKLLTASWLNWFQAFKAACQQAQNYNGEIGLSANFNFKLLYRQEGKYF